MYTDEEIAAAKKKIVEAIEGGWESAKQYVSTKEGMDNLKTVGILAATMFFGPIRIVAWGLALMYTQNKEIEAKRAEREAAKEAVGK